MTDPFREQLQHALAPAYTIERELLGGGMSHVFVATEHALGRTVVVKVLKPEMAAGMNRERFRREIMLAAQLQHPHIVPVLSAGQDGDLLWYTMPFVDGESLREALARHRQFSTREVMRVLHDVLDALAYAHRRGVVHRDIKPGNILRQGSHSLVTDFGVAKALSAAMPHSGTTSVGIAIGTPAYMAPEQLAADPSADHRMDLYAVGLLAYELLTGDQPFGGQSPQATMAAQLTRMPTPLEECCPGVPTELSGLITRLLAKNPEERPASASAALEELEGFATPSATTASTTAPLRASGGKAIPVSGESTIAITQAPARSTRRLVMLSIAGLAAVALGIVLGAELVQRAKRDNVTPVVSTITPRDTAPAVQLPAPRTPAAPPRRDSLRQAPPREPVSPSRTAARPSADSSRGRPATAGINSAGASGGGRSGATTVGGSGLGGSGVGVNAAQRSEERARAAASASASRTAVTRIDAPKRTGLNGAPLRVAVLPVRDATTRPALAPVARAFEDSLKSGITAAGYTLASDAELVRLLAESDQGAQRRVAEAAGIGAIVTGILTVRTDEITAQTIIMDVWRGMPYSERDAADVNDPKEAFGVVRDVTRALRRVSWRTRSDPRRVLVFDLENQTGVDSLTALAQELGESIRNGLAQRLGVHIVNDSAARQTKGTDERRQAGINQFVGAIVAGGIYRPRGDTITVRMSMRDMSDERTFPQFELKLTRSAFQEGVAVLLARLSEEVAKVNWGPKGLD